MRIFKVELKQKHNLGLFCKDETGFKVEKGEKDFILPFHKLKPREKIREKAWERKERKEEEEEKEGEEKEEENR